MPAFGNQAPKLSLGPLGTRLHLRNDSQRHTVSDKSGLFGDAVDLW